MSTDSRYRKKMWGGVVIVLFVVLLLFLINTPIKVSAANKTYKITFDANGGTGSVPPTITKSGADTSVVMGDITSTIPTWSGRKFTGWSADGGVHKIAYLKSTTPDADTQTSGSWTYADYCSYTGGSTSSTTLALKACWVSDMEFTLKVDPAGGIYKGTTSVTTYTWRSTQMSSGTNTYSYTGNYQTYTTPHTGWYILEAGGGKGGDDATPGGKGGCIQARVRLSAGTTLYLGVAQNGWKQHGNEILAANPCYGAGGRAGNTGNAGNFSGVGGGASTVAISLRGNGDIRNYTSDMNQLLIVAGGGGGGSSRKSGNGGDACYSSSGRVSGSDADLWKKDGVLQYALGKNPGTSDGGGGGGGYYGGLNGLDDTVNGGRHSGGGASFYNSSRGVKLTLFKKSSSAGLVDGKSGGYVSIGYPMENYGACVLSTPTKKGYHFGGWTVKSGCGRIDYDDYTGEYIVWYSPEDPDNPPSNTETVVEPIWIPNTYYVSYSKGLTNNGGSTSTTSHTYDADVTLAANGFTGRSYTIMYNSNTPSEATHTVTNMPSSQTGTLSFNKWSVSATQNSGSYTASTNLGAKNFEYEQYATAYATALWYDKDVTTNYTPALKGWIFLGWSESSTATSGSNNFKDTIQPSTSAYSKTYYAIWKPIEYDIYYNKGLTDDESTQSITDATRNSNIQSSGTNRPYTHTKYDTSVKLANILPVLGRSYSIKFNSNKPISVSKQLQNNSAIPTTTSTITGNLSTASKWQISGQDSDVTTNLQPSMSNTISKPNYTAIDNGTVDATALWNNKDVGNYEEVSLEGWKFVGWYDNQRGTDSKAVSSINKNTWFDYYTTKVNKSTNKSGNNNVVVNGDLTDYIVEPSTSAFDRELYARWQREITLTFDLTGGRYRNQSDTIVETGIYYNNSDGYTFNLEGGFTNKSLPEYETQLSTFKVNNVYEGIDAYGTYNKNGENSKYTKVLKDGTTYRFLGWSKTPDADEPDAEFDVYSDSHVKQYKIYDSLTLYAIWEPVLKVDTSVIRVLGNMKFSDGSNPKSEVTEVRASDGLQFLEVICKPGEQCKYTINMTGSNDIKNKVEFDESITDIYTHYGTWIDFLNPSTPEDLIENQKHGLNRLILSPPKCYMRKFHIPEYLGTERSYVTSIGKKIYTMDMKISQYSYYYYKKLGMRETVNLETIIYLNDEKSNKAPIITVLDELRTKLKVKIK